MLFKIRERERLINRNTELAIEAAKVPLLEQRIAELEVLVVELRNQRAQQPPEKNVNSPIARFHGGERATTPERACKART